MPVSFVSFFFRLFERQQNRLKLQEAKTTGLYVERESDWVERLKRNDEWNAECAKLRFVVRSPIRAKHLVVVRYRHRHVPVPTLPPSPMFVPPPPPMFVPLPLVCPPTGGIR